MRFVKFFNKGTNHEFQIAYNVPPFNWYVSLHKFIDAECYMNSIGLGKLCINWGIPIEGRDFHARH